MHIPDFPAGPPTEADSLTPTQRRTCIEEIADAPRRLREAVTGLSDAALDTKYRNWTIRQIVHHLADSHAHALLRFKLALTEERPVIKPYDEAATVRLADSAGGDVESALLMIEGVHRRWVLLLQSMHETDFARSYIHPEHGRAFTLDQALAGYPWHARHHVGQIAWLREQNSW
ncbi:MAG: YfiT family bacillithiol transferase [Planctomycetota bacterium]